MTPYVSNEDRGRTKYTFIVLCRDFWFPRETAFLEVGSFPENCGIDEVLGGVHSAFRMDLANGFCEEYISVSALLHPSCAFFRFAVIECIRCSIFVCD